VSTVDAFQGCECDVIILATTRTEHLGFIVDRRRLNTSITRARHLVVLGSRKLLETDAAWKAIIDAA
ncbi:hypothetical protein M885DRAFT_425714, partial [Pelagophyceae sp. CCMP2097]